MHTIILWSNYIKYLKQSMTNLTRSQFQAHPFHLVSPSPWPLYTCIALLTLTTSGVLTMHGFSNANLFLTSAFISVILSMSFWWRDVISEGTYLGNHTLAVQKGLNMGVALFIVSEALFFLAIFWAFFHSALSPTVELGAQWPPMGIEAINPFELPLLNTVILLSSGVTVTYAHHSLIQGNRAGALYGLVATVILAVLFYRITRCRIQCVILYYKWRSIWYMFLLWNWFSRVTCNDWNCFYRRRFMTCPCLSLNRKSSFRFRI